MNIFRKLSEYFQKFELDLKNNEETLIETIKRPTKNVKPLNRVGRHTLLKLSVSKLLLTKMQKKIEKGRSRLYLQKNLTLEY